MATVKSSAGRNSLSSRKQNWRNSSLRWVMLATAPVACGLVSAAHGQSLIFDASGSATSTGTVTDGSGFWDVTNVLGNPDTNWFGSLFDTTWVNGNAAVFGNAANNAGSGAAGNVNIDDDSGSVSASAITFNAAQSGNYTISAISGDLLALTGTAALPAAITVATGQSPTISAPISGANGLTLVGPGTLNLAGANTYSGNTVINSGTLNLNAGGTLGSTSAGLVLGIIGATPGGSPAPLGTSTTLNLNTSATVGSMTVNTNSTAANVLTITGGQTLAVLGAYSEGLNPKTGTGTTHSNLTITGAGGLNVTNSSGSFAVGTGETDAANPPSAAQTDATLNMSGLANFTFSTSSGEFDLGLGAHGQGVVQLANTSNSITAATVRVGDSTDGTVSGNAGSASSLSLGAGSNVIDANQINVGEVKDTGTINFLTSTGTLAINNEAGTGGANMNVGAGASGSSSANGTVNLSGHAVSLTLGTLNIGNRTNSVTVNVGATGAFSFDSGVVNVTTLILAHAQGSSSTNGFATGTLTVGGNPATTGTLNVNIGNAPGSENIANGSSGTGSTATGTLNVNVGGVANFNANIVTSVIAGNTATGTVNLAGGVLNMMGNNIGGTTPVILNSTSGVLENVNAINNTAGVTMNTGGNTLTLDGTNHYTGGTTINAGTLQVGQASDAAPLTSPLGAATGAVSNATTLNFASSQATTIANAISGVGVVNQNGAGITTLTGASTYTGATSVNTGGLALGAGGSLGNTAVTVASMATFQANAGAAIGTTDAGTANGSLTINSGGTLSVVDSGTAGNLNINQQSGAISGAVGLALVGTTNLNFQLDAAAVDGISLNNLLTVSDSGSTNLVNILTAGDASLTPGAYILITDANGDVSGGGTASFKFASDSASTETVTVGAQQYQLTLSTSSTSETLNVAAISSGPANLTWNNAGGNNLWDTAASSNWNNGAANAVFNAQDNVTFNDNNGGAGNYAVTLNTTVTPGSVTFSNSSGNYTISGTGSITGTGSLTKSGTATVTLSTLNTFTGGTNVSAGLLVIAPTTPTSATISALAKGALTISGTGKVQLATNVTLGSQSISPAAPTSNVNITSLAISGSGTLDINNNHIIIDYTPGNDPIASIAALITSGFNGGGANAWTGTGITSTAAQANASSYGIGYADSADPGNPAGLSSGQIEVMYTLLGDANLDGKVNGSDFSILAVNFNKAVSGWDQGDFNYDGKDNGADFTDLAANFNKGASQAADLAALESFAAANGLSADVPEPASAGLLVLAGMGMLGRRKRKHHAQ